MLRVKRIFVIIVSFVALVTTTLAGEVIATQIPDSIIEQIDSTIVAPLSTDIIAISDSIIDSPKINDSVRTEPIDAISAKAIKALDKLEEKPFKPSPKKAVIYSAIFPGLGQIYNKKYWKLPILYGGFVGVWYAITWNNSHYKDYFQAYKHIIDGNPETNSWHNLIPYGQSPENIDKNRFTTVLKDRKNYFRYYRDLSVIIGVALYGLGIVDAYVDAQLFEFDVSPDLSLKVEPVLMQKNNNSNNFLADSFGFKCSISF